MKRTLLYHCASAAIALSIATPLAAQTADAAQKSDADSEGGIQEITVTARRVEENVQDTPVAVSAFSSDALAQAQISGTDGLAAVTPSLQIQGTAPNSGNPAAAQIYIRGIGQSETAPGVDPGVGIYIDGVYLGSAVGGVMDFRDLANIQVLRGPQGTLFGRNTIGGAILITSNDPGQKFGGRIYGGIGSDRQRDVRAAVDVPLSETLTSRWTFGNRTRDGYVRRITDGTKLGDVNSYTVTGKMLWKPNSDFKVMLKGDYTNEKSNGTPLVASATRSVAITQKSSFEAGCPGMASAGSPVPNINDLRCYNNFLLLGPHATASTFALGSQVEQWGIQGNLEYRVNDAITLKSISAYRDLSYSGRRDADNSPLIVSHSIAAANTWQFSQELEMFVTLDHVSVISGLYYFKTKSDYKFLSIFNPPTNPFGTPNPATGQSLNLNGVYNNHNWAAFAQANVEPIEGLQITGGIRYTKETKALTPDQYVEGLPNQPLVPRREYKFSDGATTGTASIQYRWAPEISTYVSWTRGYKAGGWNRSYTAVTPTARFFAPETADAWEVGAKIDIARKLRLNVAGFRTRYKDIQLVYRLGPTPTVFNGGLATIKGLEGELTFAPTRAIQFNANLSYLDNKINRISPITGATTGVTTANSLPYVPKWQGQGAAQYTADIGDLTATLRGAVNLVGKQFFDIGNDPFVSQRNNEITADLGATFEHAASQITVRAGVKNLTDNVYATTGNSALGGVGYDEIAYNRGREWTISIEKKF